MRSTKRITLTLRVTEAECESIIAHAKREKRSLSNLALALLLTVNDGQSTSLDGQVTVNDGQSTSIDGQSRSHEQAPGDHQVLRRKEDLHGVDEEGEPTGEENQPLTRLGSDSPNKKKRTRKFDPDTEAWATKTIKISEPYVGHPDGARKVLRKIGAADRADFDGALQAWVDTGNDRRFCDLVKLASGNNWRRYLKPEKVAPLFEEGSPEWFQEYQRTHRPVI